MKIGVSSYSFNKYAAATGCDRLALCDKAKEIGFDGIEFTDLNVEDPIGLAKAIRAHCEELGLAITAYAIGANFLAEDPEAEVARVLREVDVCEALGAKLMRHDVCYALPKEHLYSWRDAAEYMAPYIRRVTEAGGYLVHAHPYRQAHYIIDFKPDPASVPAYEVFNACNGVTDWNTKAYREAKEHGLLMLAGSDAHTTDGVRGGGMRFSRPVHSMQEIFQALREGDGQIIEKLPAAEHLY